MQHRPSPFPFGLISTARFTDAAKKVRPMDSDVYAWLVDRLYQLGKPSTTS
jgi:hypothetical protein